MNKWNKGQNMIREVKATQSCPTLWDPWTIHSPWNSPSQNTGGSTFPISRRSSQPRDRTQVSCTAGGLFPSEPQGKPKNTGVGSLSLHQKIFPTQESNWSPLYCRQILYQLSYEGSHNMEREGGSGNILYRALVMIHEVEQFHMKVNGAYLKIYVITKDSFFSSGAGKSDFRWKTRKLKIFFTSYMKVKGIIDLNIKCKNIKHLKG